MSPFPLPILSCRGSCIIYLRSKAKDDNKNPFENNFLITANNKGETFEIVIDEIDQVDTKEEDKYGCSDGHNIGKAILPLFAFNLLKDYEKKRFISEDEPKKAIELSISSGVLCKFTGFVDISKNTKVDISNSDSDGKSFNLKRKKGTKAKRCVRHTRCNISDDADADSSSDSSPKYSKQRQKVCMRPRGCIRSAPKKCTRKSDISDSDSSSDSEPKQKKCSRIALRANKKYKMRVNKKMDDEDSDDDDLNMNSKRIFNSKAKKPTKSKAMRKMSDSEDEDEIPKKPTKSKAMRKISDSEDEVVPKKGAKSKAAKKVSIPKLSEKIDSEEEEVFTTKRNKKRKNIDSDEEINENPKGKPYDLMSLLRLQNFHGYWEDLYEINAMLGSNISSIDGVDVPPMKLDTKCIATILAIAALHVKSNDQKNLWTMIEQKALNWLKKSLPEEKINQLIKKAESLIN